MARCMLPIEDMGDYYSAKLYINTNSSGGSSSRIEWTEADKLGSNRKVSLLQR